jgi:TonB family protein
VSQPAKHADGKRQISFQLPWSSRTTLLIVGALVAFVLSWAGLRALRSNPTPVAPPAVASAPIPAPVARQLAPPTPTSAPGVSSTAGEAAGPTAPVHEVIPDVPRRARQTIQGHIKVSVRVIVDKDGTVFAALTEVRGPSRYFERLALDAAKKWTFTAGDSDTQRLMLIRFDFSRQGATARATAIK